MKKSLIKKITAVVLSTVMLLGSAPLSSVSHAAMPSDGIVDHAVLSDGLVREFVSVPKAALSSAKTADEILRSPVTSMITTDLKASAYYKNSWEKYNSYYYYNRLSKKEKKLYNALNTVCLNYLRGKGEGVSTYYDKTTNKEYYILPYIYCDDMGLSNKQITRTYNLFRLENPQYFFLNNAVSAAYQSAIVSGVETTLMGSYIGLCVYKKFADRDEVITAKNEIMATVDGWDDEISEAATDAEKVRVIHDLIITRANYNHKFYEEGYDDDLGFTQSLYSALVLPSKETVCAGYSYAFAFICNKYGIDAVSITSAAHQWNAVCVDDQWYQIDLTWDDSDSVKGYNYPSEVFYLYFCRDNTYMESSTETDSGENHQDEWFFKGYAPECNIDTGSTYETPGELYVPTKTVKACTVTVKKNYKTVIKTKTKNAVIYYTIDGTKPDPASTKTLIYTGPVKIKKGKTLRAIAVCPGYYNSKVTKKKIKYKK